MVPIDYGLWIMDYGLWIMDYGLWIMDYGLWIKDYGLWIMDYGLRISDYGFCARLLVIESLVPLELSCPMAFLFCPEFPSLPSELAGSAAFFWSSRWISASSICFPEPCSRNVAKSTNLVRPPWSSSFAAATLGPLTFFRN